MKKHIFIFILVLLAFKLHAHTSHYEGIVKIEMEVFRNNEKIGYSNYFFEHENDIMTVKNYTKFKVELFGATIFSISNEAIEKYKNNQLVSFKSNTFQNNKEKYVNLYYDDSLKKFIIDGSSYKGEANIDCVIGNWWNHELLKAKKQISPISGSIKEQIVTFVAKEKVIINGKEYETDHFKLTSKDMTLPDDKRLNFEIWLDKKTSLIVKVTYQRMGNWEYRLKNID